MYILIIYGDKCKMSHNLEKYYVNNIFTILSQQILSGRLYVDISGTNGRFKLELITTKHL